MRSLGLRFVLRCGLVVLGVAFGALEAAAQGASPPAFIWARAAQGTGENSSTDVTTDSEGNIYITGSFRATVDFDPGPGMELRSSAGATDIFVWKLDPTGNLIWVRTFGGSGFDAGTGIAVDDAGNVYATGIFSNTVDFDPGEGVAEVSTDGGSFTRDTFVLKLDAAGDLVWVRAYGGASVDEPSGIAVDADGNVYTAGRFLSTVDFDPGPGTVAFVSAGGSDIYVHKLDSEGNFEWVRVFGGAEDDAILDLDVDAEFGITVAGSFRNQVDFGDEDEPILLSAGFLSRVFVARFGFDGSLAWVRAFGGDGVDEARGLAVASDGSVYTTGTFVGTADFDPSEDTFTVASGSLFVSRAAFVHKLTADGDFEWVRWMSGEGQDIGEAIAVAPDGDVFAVGTFRQTVDFDRDGDGFVLTSPGGQDGFVQQWSPDGDFRWAGAFASTSFVSASAVTVNNDGNIVVAGRFPGETDFDPSEETQILTSAGSTDIFVVKLGDPSSVPAALAGRIEDALGDPVACATVDVESEDGTRTTAVTDENGVFTLTRLAPGTYALRVRAPGFATQQDSAVTLAPAETLTRTITLLPRPAGPVLTGVVTDLDADWACVGALVELRLDGAFYDDAFTCADGRYEIALPLAKQNGETLLEIEVSLENYETAQEAVLVSPGESEELDVALKRAVFGIAAIVGEVRGGFLPSSAPVPGARIVLRGPINASTQADQSGLFSLETLIDGVYTATATAPGFTSQTLTRTLAPGEVSVTEFALEALGDEPEPTQPGDVDGDGLVNAVDVQLVINAALGIGIDAGFNADINGDGLVNAVDVQLVINAALGIPINP